MIQVSNLSKSYGLGHLLLDDVSFNINSGERIGLVGRNGHGKTTLLRLISGEEEPDSGVITIPKNYIIGYLEQRLHFSEDTILKEACLGLRPEHRNDFWRAEKMLSGLGFSMDDMKRNPSVFSGGFQVRLNLAKVLAGEPNLLLLDEPTNYLDIVSIRWLSRLLNSWKNELLLVTHDRSFMDSVTTHTMGIHRRKIKKVAGGTEKLYNQIIQEEEIYEKTRQNDEKKRKEIELFITRFRAKARLGGLVQSRVKLLDKTQKLNRLEKIKTLEFSFREESYTGKWTVEGNQVSFSYINKAPFLIDKFSIIVGKNDRIGIIGRNGKGKTTLLKLLAGKLQPLEGEVKTHPLVKIGYFGQTNIDLLFDENTVEEEIYNAHPDKNRQEARDICGAMLFEGDQALKKVSVLSGGEKSRVLLGKLLVSPTHLLLLDEPTNHLDMESCDSLLAALDSYDGAVVIVTHNEMFLNALVNRLIVFDKGKITVFEGSYNDFLNDVGWESEEGDFENGQTVNLNNKKAIRKARAEINEEKSRVLKPIEKKIKLLENTISCLEEELHKDKHILIEASIKSDGASIAELSMKTHQTQSKIDKLYEELLQVTEDYETAAKKF